MKFVTNLQVAIALIFCVHYITCDLGQKIAFEKANMDYINAEYVKDVKFDFKEKGNKFSLSTSYNLLKEMDAGKVMVLGQLYIAKDGDYKLQPMDLELNVCKEYTEQKFGKWQAIEKFGNITGCGIKKPGMYQLTDFVPEIPMQEYTLPEGNYKTESTLKYEDVKLSTISMYFKI